MILTRKKKIFVRFFIKEDVLVAWMCKLFSKW